MSTNREIVDGRYDVETAATLIFALGLVTGLISWDPIVGLAFGAVGIVIYLLYSILRTLELIAMKL